LKKIEERDKFEMLWDFYFQNTIDIKSHPQKPEYPLAYPNGLILRNCQFSNLNFIHTFKVSFSKKLNQFQESSLTIKYNSQLYH